VIIGWEGQTRPQIHPWIGIANFLYNFSVPVILIPEFIYRSLPVLVNYPRLSLARDLILIIMCSQYVSL